MKRACSRQMAVGAARNHIEKFARRSIFAILCFVWLAPLTASAQDAATEQAAFQALLHYTLAREVREAAERLAGEATPADAAAVREVAQDWMNAQIERLRRQLERAYGDAARERFESFSEEFLAAESDGNPQFLDRLAQALGARPPPSDYAALRRWAMERWLSAPLAEGTRLLSELQTWAEIRARDPGAPALEAWLERNLTASPPPRQPPPLPARPRNPLAEAEARAPEFDSTVAASAGALDAFAQQRKERRARALEQAQAGMSQLAAERQAFEQEAAARKLAQAQAEAEAMKAQAQKLAAAEEEAMKQRENSWGNRLKRLVAGTIGAATGAFSGGIGAEAGRRAAMEIFR